MKGFLILTLFIVSFINYSCTRPGFYRSEKESIKFEKSKVNYKADSLKNFILKKLGYIMSSAEIKSVKKIETIEGLNSFIDHFWKSKDPTPGTEKNEYKNEYYLRIEAADKLFKYDKPGSETARGRIYILYGPPDEVVKENMLGPQFAYNDGTLMNALEIWLYDKPGGSNAYENNIFNNKFPGQMKFVFGDVHCFGEYELVYSTEPNEWIDPRTYWQDYN